MRDLLSSLSSVICIIGVFIAQILFSRVRKQAQSDGYHTYSGHSTQFMQVVFIIFQFKFIWGGIEVCALKVRQRRQRNQLMREREIVPLDQVIVGRL